MGLMADLEPKGEGDKSMPGNQWPGPGVGAAFWGTRVIRRRLDCLKPNLQRWKFASTGKTPVTGAGPANGEEEHRRNLRGLERCPVRALKEMSGTPTSRCTVRQGRTWDRLPGASPTATEAS